MRDFVNTVKRENILLARVATLLCSQGPVVTIESLAKFLTSFTTVVVDVITREILVKNAFKRFTFDAEIGSTRDAKRTRYIFAGPDKSCGR